MWRWRWRRNTCVVLLPARRVWVRTVIRFTYSINIVLSSILTYKRGNADSSLFYPTGSWLCVSSRDRLATSGIMGLVWKFQKRKRRKSKSLFVLGASKQLIGICICIEKRGLHCFKLMLFTWLESRYFYSICKKVALCCFKICLDTFLRSCVSNCKFRVVNKHRSRKTELLLLSFIVLLVSCNKTIANFTLFLIIFLPIIKKTFQNILNES